MSGTCSLLSPPGDPWPSCLLPSHYFANKDLSVKAMVFPVVMYGYENWTVKKAEHWRIDAFELWCRRRLLRVPWTARRSNQSILKEISPEYSLEGMILMLKLQSFGNLMWRTDPFEKILLLGKIEGRRRRGWQKMIWLECIADSKDMCLCKFWELMMYREAWCVLQSLGWQRVRYNWATELNWTEWFFRWFISKESASQCWRQERRGFYP